MDPGIGQEVAGHLAEPGLVARYHERVGMVEGDGPVGGDGGQVGQGVAGHGHKVDRRPLQRATLVEPGQQQQVLDEEAHAGGLVLDAAHGPGQVLGSLGRAPAEQLGVTPDGGQGGAQLVGGVGDEAAQPVLRRGLLGEGRLDLGQHGVERQTEPADLGVGFGRLHPAGEVAAGDVAGGGGDAFERQQAEAHDRQRQQGQEEEHGRRRRHLDAEQPAQRLVELGGGEGDEQRGAVAAGSGQHPVAEVSVLGADGGVLARPPRAAVGQVGYRLARSAGTAGRRRPARRSSPKVPLGMTDRPDGRRRPNARPEASSL